MNTDCAYWMKEHFKLINNSTYPVHGYISWLINRKNNNLLCSIDYGITLEKKKSSIASGHVSLIVYSISWIVVYTCSIKANRLTHTRWLEFYNNAKTIYEVNFRHSVIPYNYVSMLRSL